MKYLLMPSG